MAKFVSVKARVSVSYGTTRAWHELDGIRSATLDLAGDAPDFTAMGNDWRVFLRGLRSWSGSLEIFQDGASNAADARMWDIYTTSGTVKIAISFLGVAASTMNASPIVPDATDAIFYGNIVPTYSVPASIGAEAVETMTFQGSGELSRSSGTTSIPA